MASTSKILRISTAKPIGLVTEFQGQKLELNTGRWVADDMGISADGDFKTLKACSHPIMPVERLVIDTGMEKLRIAFRTGKRWREQVG